MSKAVVQIKKFDGKQNLSTADFAFVISEAANLRFIPIGDEQREINQLKIFGEKL